MRQLRIPLLTLTIAGLLALAAGPAGATNPANSPVQYFVKYVCGFVPTNPPGEEGPVKPGNYATAINIQNHTPASIFVALRLNLHYRAGSPIPPLIPHTSVKAVPLRTLEVDCPYLWTLAGLPPGTFVKGMVHLGVREPLPVAVVYTSQTYLGPGTALDAGAGISIDVEQVSPFIAP